MSRKTALNVVIALGAGALGVYLSRGPWVAYRQQQQKASQANSELAKTEASYSLLTEQKAKLDSAQGQEQLAREKLYRRKNEVPVVVSGGN